VIFSISDGRKLCDIHSFLGDGIVGDIENTPFMGGIFAIAFDRFRF